MEKEVIITATTIEEAIEQALEKLGGEREDIEIEILEEPSKKLFGGTTDAKIRVVLTASPQAEEEADEEEQGAGVFIGDEAEDEENFITEEEERNYNEAFRQLTEEELDKIADTAIETIRGLLEFFGAEDSEIDEYEGEEGELILDIMGDNLAVLIGRHGKTLDSIQFLVSTIVSKKTGYRHPVVVDVKGYKHRRKQKIISIAKASAARAIRQKQEVKLRPMTPYERRVVHVALRDDKRVITASEGVEPNRYVVIQLS